MRRSCDGSNDHEIFHIEVCDVGVDDSSVGIRVIINFFAALYKEGEEASMTSRPCSRSGLQAILLKVRLAGNPEGLEDPDGRGPEDPDGRDP